MKKNILVLFVLIMISLNMMGQAFEKLKITDAEMPEEYSLTDEPQCQAIQSCLLYKQIDMYSSFLGKVKSKEVQNFISKDDSGSIMYFEFENDFEGEGFLEGLLWGQPGKPTKAHPEEFVSKGKILIVYSFKIKSDFKKLAQDKINSVLN